MSEVKPRFSSANSKNEKKKKRIIQRALKKERGWSHILNLIEHLTDKEQETEFVLGAKKGCFTDM